MWVFVRASEDRARWCSCVNMCVANATYVFLSKCVITDERFVFIGVLRSSNIGVYCRFFGKGVGEKGTSDEPSSPLRLRAYQIRLGLH